MTKFIRVSAIFAVTCLISVGAFAQQSGDQDDIQNTESTASLSELLRQAEAAEEPKDRSSPRNPNGARGVETDERSSRREPGNSTGRFSDISPTVGAQVSTRGIGAQFKLQLNPKFAFRAAVDTGKLNSKTSAEFGAMEGEQSLLSGGVMAEYYPSGENFFISVGALAIGDNVEMAYQFTAEPVSFAGLSLDENVIESISSQTSYSSFAPQFTVGIDTGHANDARWSLFGEIGALYRGSPETKLTASGVHPIVSGSINTALEEAEQDFKFGNDSSVWPIVSLGGRFRF